MDLSLEIGNAHYNARVSARIVYRGGFVFDYDDESYFPIGGRIKSGETRDEAIQREVKEELGIEIHEFSCIGVGQASFFSVAKQSQIFEHNFVYDVVILDEIELEGHYEIISQTHPNIRPNYLNRFDENFIQEDFDTFQFSTMDVSKLLPDTIEFNVRISAIIRNKDQILFDVSSFDAQHKVLIGGRMQMGERFEDALKREVSEELHVDILSSKFLGIGEDFFDLKLSENKTKKIHFISFVFEIEVDNEAIVFDDGCVGVWFHPDELGELHMDSVKKYL